MFQCGNLLFVLLGCIDIASMAKMILRNWEFGTEIALINIFFVGSAGNFGYPVINLSVCALLGNIEG
jgi:hypothetical protein